MVFKNKTNSSYNWLYILIGIIVIATIIGVIFKKPFENFDINNFSYVTADLTYVTCSGTNCTSTTISPNGYNILWNKASTGIKARINNNNTISGNIKINILPDVTGSSTTPTLRLTNIKIIDSANNTVYTDTGKTGINYNYTYTQSATASIDKFTNRTTFTYDNVKYFIENTIETILKNNIPRILQEKLQLQAIKEQLDQRLVDSEQLIQMSDLRLQDSLQQLQKSQQDLQESQQQQQKSQQDLQKSQTELAECIRKYVESQNRLPPSDLPPPFESLPPKFD